MSSSPPGTEEDTAGGGMVDGEAPRAHAGGGGGSGAGENHTASGSDGEEDEMDGGGGGGDSDGRDYSDDDGDDSDGSDSDEEEGRGEEGGGGGRVLERKAAEAEAEVKPRAVATCCICMEPWASDGAHRICCISCCGHVYGRSCLERWLFRRGGDDGARCPQCGNTFKHEHIINLYSTVHLWNDCYHKERDEEMMDRIRQLCEQESRRCALHVEKKLKAELTLHFGKKLKAMFELLLGHMERTLENNQSMSQMEVINFMMQNWSEFGL